MSDFIDASVLVAAVVSSEAFHEECLDLVLDGGLSIFGHGVAETFSTLTGGRKNFKLRASLAMDILEADFLPHLTLTTLTPAEMLRAMREAEPRGVRGGGIFDYLHLVAARKAKAKKFYTLNISNFRSFHRAGDPDIVHP